MGLLDDGDREVHDRNLVAEREPGVVTSRRHVGHHAIGGVGERGGQRVKPSDVRERIVLEEKRR